MEVRPIAFIGQDSQRGRAALLAAGMQNKLFNFMQLMYNNQGPENTSWLNDDLITSAAASIPGVDVDQLLDGTQLEGGRGPDRVPSTSRASPTWSR